MTNSMEEAEKQVREKIGEEEELLKLLHERLEDMKTRTEQILEEIEQTEEDVVSAAEAFEVFREKEVEAESVEDLEQGKSAEKPVAKRLEDLGIDLDRIREGLVEEAEETEATINLVKNEMEDFNQLRKMLNVLNRERLS